MSELRVSLNVDQLGIIEKNLSSRAFSTEDEVIGAAIDAFGRHEAMHRELLALKYGEVVREGIRQAKAGEFSPLSFDEIIEEARRGSTS